VVYRSRMTEIEIPDVSLTALILGGGHRFGDKAALVDAVTGETITYSGLRASALEGAAGLAGLGIGVGDVVALLSHNQPRFAIAAHAVMAAGAAVTPVNPLLTPNEVAKQLTGSRAKMMITSEEAAGKAVEAAEAAGVEHVIVIGRHGDLPRLADLIAGRAGDAGDAVARPGIDPDTTIAALPFSSGTTGLPKGVMLTHRNLVANLLQNQAGWQLTSDDVLAGAIPFFHIYGFTLILNAALLVGATVITMPRFEPRSYLRTLQDHRVTRAFFVPPMLLALADSPEADQCDLSSLRLGVCGAAPINVPVTERAEKRLGCPIRQGYGMTEASPGTHLTPYHLLSGIPLGSVGSLAPCTEARIVDPVDGVDVEPGRTGELWVRGPQVMAGYLGNPQATAETVVDGWLRTGDLARVDSDGIFWIVDRLKELIKYKGYQVAPAELESLLLTHPDVADVAVVGVPHGGGGEAPKAFVVARRAMNGEELMAWVAGRVAPYKKVREVEFVEAIPKSASGKVLRRLLTPSS
jgi:acyl-CoA synthetase (AMP-forming)/AMP-acid ligase II